MRVKIQGIPSKSEITYTVKHTTEATIMKYNGFFYNMFKGSMKKVIAEHYGKEFADEVMSKSKAMYRKLIAEADDMGKGNPMAHNFYFAIAFVAPYLASDKKIAPEVVQEMMKAGLYHVKWFFSRTNVNTAKGKLENSAAVRKYYKWYTPEREKLYPTSFKVDFEGIPHEGACYYRITRCAVCPYVEKIGAGELMPLLCDLDAVMIGMQHGVLHREHTIAKGEDYCDYYITGDKEEV